MYFNLRIFDIANLCVPLYLSSACLRWCFQFYTCCWAGEWCTTNERFRSYALWYFFFEEIFKVEKLWQARFESVPKNLEESEIYSIAGGDKLTQFNDLIIIDGFAKQYGYSHEEVFKLDWEFVYTMQYIHNLQDSVQKKAQEERSRRNKNKR